MSGPNQKERERAAKAQRLYAASKPGNLTPPATYGNATTKEAYTGNVMQSPRADADEHFNHASLGLAAQIKTVSQKQKPQAASPD